MNVGTVGTVESQAMERSLKHAGIMDCSTCESRKYKDGSDESNVSFKSAAHIDPSASTSRVMAHEQEHVSNAYSKAANNNGEVIFATVTLKTAVCPECGRNYVSGGVTHTAIKYKSDNPYANNQKSSDYAAVSGANVDTGV